MEDFYLLLLSKSAYIFVLHTAVLHCICAIFNYNSLDERRLIIYHDFLRPPRRGSHIKSDNTHTIINIHHLAHILDICALIFSSSALFAVSSNHIIWRHPTPLQVITTRARVGGPKEHRAKQNWPLETHSVTYVPGLTTVSGSFAH